MATTEADALKDIIGAYSAFYPPRRVCVSEGVAQNLYIREPGGYSGPWSASEAPYMVNPMDTLSSRDHEAVCFVGPSRSGKTAGLLDGFFTYAATCDPGDMLIVQMDKDKAREFSKTRIDRAIRNSPALAALMSGRTHDDNTHDKMLRHGMWLKIGYPTSSQLSGMNYRYVGLTDYDRMPDNIDGEGDAFGLALTRTRTFLSRGMCMVESSPGREIVDPNWRPATPHEAPPCTGILGIYNRSDRRRWYWPCPHCSAFFQATPGLELFATLPDESALIDKIRSADINEMAKRHAVIVCPSCGSIIEQKHKAGMNASGVWVPDGKVIDGFGRLSGESPKSSIAGYWLGGVSAAYQNWYKLMLAYLQALREYVLTGSELPLQKTTNTDQAMPFLPRHLAEAAKARQPSEKTEHLERYVVPPEARFIVAAVDIQGGQDARFVVQVHAIGEHLEQWIINRFDIRLSDREGVDGGKAPIDPASHPEDWDLLTSKVVLSTYRISDGREMRVRMVAVDTGGEDGVTQNAYSWFRRVRADGNAHRVMLVKGASSKPRTTVLETMVGAKETNVSPDVPLYLLGTDELKDAVSGALQRENPGPGYLHIPHWLPASFFDELKSEYRGANGKWVKIRRRNEAFDLCAYIRAACIRLGADRFDWGSLPPAYSWAYPLEANADVIDASVRREILAAQQAGAPQQPATRRVSRSSYLR